MTFADPYLLIALVAVPLGLVAYVVFARRGRRTARAAANPALWPNLMPRRPGWRRHVPPVLLLLALASLLVGVARPQALMASDQKQTTVVLAVDSSNSMAAKDVSPSRIAAARAAARDLIEGLPKNARLGLVSFARDVRVLQAPTDDRAAFGSALAHLTLRGGTTLGAAIDRSVASLRASHPARKGRAIIVISDGKSTEGKRSPIAAATGRQGCRRARLHRLARYGRRHRHGAGPAGQPSRPTRPRSAASRRPAAGASTAPRTRTRCGTPTATSAARSGPRRRSATSASRSWAARWRSWPVAACSRWPGSAACSDPVRVGVRPPGPVLRDARRAAP